MREQPTHGKHGQPTKRSRGTCQNLTLLQNLLGTTRHRGVQKVQAILHSCILATHSAACESSHILQMAKEMFCCTGAQAAIDRTGWGSQRMSAVASRSSMPGAGWEAALGRGERGVLRKGAQQQRAPRLTHRERVKLMLDSNRRIKLACAAVEVWQVAGPASGCGR